MGVYFPSYGSKLVEEDSEETTISTNTFIGKKRVYRDDPRSDPKNDDPKKHVFSPDMNALNVFLSYTFTKLSAQIE